MAKKWDLGPISDVEEGRYVVTGNFAYLRAVELDVNYFTIRSGKSLLAPGEMEMGMEDLGTFISIPEELSARMRNLGLASGVAENGMRDTFLLKLIGEIGRFLQLRWR